MQFTVVCLFACVVVALMRAPTPNDPALTSVLPVPGKDGKDAVVDYAQVDAMIDQKVALLPKPKDGKNGADGKDGQPGKDGNTPVKGVDYFDGTPGVATQQVEFQANPFTNEVEWRCSGDMLWTTLISNPILEDACL